MHVHAHLLETKGPEDGIFRLETKKGLGERGQPVGWAAGRQHRERCGLRHPDGVAVQHCAGARGREGGIFRKDPRLLQLRQLQREQQEEHHRRKHDGGLDHRLPVFTLAHGDPCCLAIAGDPIRQGAPGEIRCRHRRARATTRGNWGVV